MQFSLGLMAILKETLKKLENELFQNHILQIPFIAKNQIVLFMYSDKIFTIWMI